MSIVVPGGSFALIASSRARTRSATCVVLYPFDFLMSMPTDWRLIVPSLRRATRTEQRQRSRLLGAVEDVGHLSEPNHLPVSLGDDDLAELLRTLETAAEANRSFVEVAGDASNRRREVLQFQRLHDLRDADARGLQRGGLDLHRELTLDLARHLDFGDAGDRAELTRQARVGEPRELARVSAYWTTARATRSADRCR